MMIISDGEMPPGKYHVISDKMWQDLCAVLSVYPDVFMELGKLESVGTFTVSPQARDGGRKSEHVAGQGDER